MNEPAPNALSSLTPEQLRDLLDILRKQTQPQSRPKLQVAFPVVEAWQYYKLTTECFDCVVDSRDVRELFSGDIYRAAYSPLQPWYYNKVELPKGCQTFDLLDYKQYVDWLRR
jgi:hypothetical protein